MSIVSNPQRRADEVCPPWRRGTGLRITGGRLITRRRFDSSVRPTSPVALFWCFWHHLHRLAQLRSLVLRPWDKSWVCSDLPFTSYRQTFSCTSCAGWLSWANVTLCANERSGELTAFQCQLTFPVGGSGA